MTPLKLPKNSKPSKLVTIPPLFFPFFLFSLFQGLSILAEEAPKGFLSISARVLTIFSESLDFPYDEDVKVHSAEGIPKVFHAWFASQEQEMVLLAGQMWRSLCPQLLKGLIPPPLLFSFVF